MAFTTSQGNTSTSLSEINVTPLVDVMLVLLIIFMVTAPMLQTGFDVDLARTKYVKPVNSERNIILTITRNANIYYGGRMIKFSEIKNLLPKDAKHEDSIFLRADGNVKWQYIVSVIDEIKGAKFNKIQLVTQPYKESETH
jgi:biopolymer transport protein TolR